ncbi:ABC transporter permease subunit [Paenibacillus bouchesdurhonensis]|uniref:ABC transporter permease subunit n=1 Tax=Paenibacillus bouchesdurhonensis TaxID=1870990 RepID=UPI000DA60489|nr:ABC transporter permease subunit [Paenibacillus bouchesdurhonensis]
MKLLGCLIANESLKLYRRRILWIMMVLLLSIIILTLIVTLSSKESPSQGWRSHISGEIQQLRAQLSDDSVPPEFKKSNIQKMINLYEYRLANDIPPLYNDTAFGFVQSTAGYTGIITLFIILLASSSVSQEYQWGTIKYLLMNPVSRWKFLLAKFFSIILVTLLFYITLICMSSIIGLVAFRLNDTSTRYVYFFKDSIRNVSIWLHFLQYFGAKLVGTIMIAAFAFMLSTIFKKNTLALTLSILIQFTGTITGSILSFLDKSIAKYLFFTNTNLYQYVEGIPPSGMSFSFSVFILSAYLIVFGFVSVIIFSKRDIT